MEVIFHLLLLYVIYITSVIAKPNPQQSIDRIVFPSEFDDRLNNVQQQNNDRRNLQRQLTTTTTIQPSQTTRSSGFWRCMSTCPTTSEYNPICGTDNLSYHNRQKLDCTNICGRRLDRSWNVVTSMRLGLCEPLF